MKIVVRTSVGAPVQRVKERFNRELFLKLNPPFPPVKLIRFDGCKKGDSVILELNFILFRQIWESLITEHFDSPDEFTFVDEGVRLPFFLKSWKHHHRVLRKGRRVDIVDEIAFRSPFRLTDYLLYPLLYLQFLYRKPIYRKVFGSPAVLRQKN